MSVLEKLVPARSHRNRPAASHQRSREQLLAERDALLASASARRAQASRLIQEKLAAFRTIQEQIAGEIAKLRADEDAAHVQFASAERIERELRASCDPSVADNSPLLTTLQQLREHIRTHGSTDAHQVRERLAFFEREYPQDPHTAELRETVAKYNAAESAVEKLNAFAREIEAMQIIAAPDTARLQAIVEQLPQRCPVPRCTLQNFAALLIHPDPR